MLGQFPQGIPNICLVQAHLQRVGDHLLDIRLAIRNALCPKPGRLFKTNFQTDQRGLEASLLDCLRVLSLRHPALVPEVRGCERQNRFAVRAICLGGFIPPGCQRGFAFTADGAVVPYIWKGIATFNAIHRQ